jgi:sodium-dependent dicarboxylate transporter 2/3/5
MPDASRRLLILVAGPLLATGVYLLLPVEYLQMDGSTAILTLGARGAAAVTAWMALWWITDVIPVYVTALLPLVLFPLLGTATIAEVAGAYGNPMIFLFFGGFILALALERWSLHRRVALSVLRRAGSRPDYIVGAFMGIAAFTSLWVTNTATTLVLLLATWLLLTRVVFSLGSEPLTGTRERLDGLAAQLGAVTRAEILTAGVFLVTAAAWVFRSPLVAVSVGGVQPFAGMTDAGIAIGAAILLFVVPSGDTDRGFLMDWPTAMRVPWGLLLLFGGGLSLAASFEQTGLAGYIVAQGKGLDQLPTWLLVMCVVTVVAFLSEIASNLATTTTVVPVLASLAIGAGLAPVPLVLAACFAASCAFMLPVATPPNAIVYGTGRVSAGQMARAGFLMKLAGIVFITAVTCGIIIPIFGAN